MEKGRLSAMDWILLKIDRVASLINLECPKPVQHSLTDCVISNSLDLAAPLRLLRKRRPNLINQLMHNSVYRADPGFAQVY